MLLEKIILLSLKKINGERTSSSVYHLLKGKRSIQTLQDARIFQIENFYGIHKNLSKMHYNHIIQTFLERNWIRNGAKDTFIVNNDSDIQSDVLLRRFNGMKYFEKAEIFYKRLVLLIQTLTNSKKDNFSFIPVIDDRTTEKWVRMIFHKVKGNETKILTTLHSELEKALSNLTTYEASLFVDRLTGYKHYGMSIAQLSIKYKMESDDTLLQIISILHQLLNNIETGAYPFLAYIIKDVDSKKHITQSANKTYQLLLQGYDVDNIAYLRNLKRNTIYDHIVEIALYNDDFSIDYYVSKLLQTEIMDAIKKANSYKLKDIKNYIDSDVTYFQIRLVLAVINKKVKFGDEDERKNMLEKVLYKYFQYSSFRQGQKEIIEDVLKGNNVLGILPTGSGKSICYQLPSILLDGVTVVVSPLISLMLDQVKQLKANHFKRVISLNSFMDYQERKRVYKNLHHYKLIYLSPELLQNKELLSSLKQLQVSLFVIDEAHCISQWGHDFRPDYLKLHQVIKFLKYPRIMALSATATPEVQEDIIETLNISKISRHIYPMDKPNIAFCIENVENDLEKNERLISIIKRYKVPTLIYFSSRIGTEKCTEILAKELPSRNIAYYHGGMEQQDRIQIQQQFMNGQLDIICCTSAFGMGINKKNIRLIVHYHLPLDMESFIQEVGRAGRDGKESVSLLLYSQSDIYLPQHMIRNELPDEEELDRVFQVLYKHYEMKKPIPENEVEKINIFQLNETIWRFLQYHLENHGIIKDNHIIFNEKQWKQSYQQLKEIILERKVHKEEKLKKMVQWVHSTSCLRENLYRPFQRENSKAEFQCCSYCDFTWDNWNPEETDFQTNIEENWKNLLRDLLLIGEDNETK